MKMQKKGYLRFYFYFFIKQNIIFTLYIKKEGVFLLFFFLALFFIFYFAKPQLNYNIKLVAPGVH